MDRVVHFEVPFDDADRAHTFYREAFGWQLQSMPGMGYTLVTSGPTGERGPTEPGFINGGMMSRSVRSAKSVACSREKVVGVNKRRFLARRVVSFTSGEEFHSEKKTA